MDPQSTCKKLGGIGAIGMMYFTADGSRAKVEYYSTVYGMYFCESNKNIELVFEVPVEETSAIEETTVAFEETTTAEETTEEDAVENETNADTDEGEHNSQSTATTIDTFWAKRNTQKTQLRKTQQKLRL